jgi:Predicted membrane protein (DUF2254)
VVRAAGHGRGGSFAVLATAGVVFSLLTLPLSTVASQFGSRLLRIFLRDRTTQLVLGMFVATFTYCLATALSIPNIQALSEEPQITVTLWLIVRWIEPTSTRFFDLYLQQKLGKKHSDVVLGEGFEECAFGGDDLVDQLPFPLLKL